MKFILLPLVLVFSTPIESFTTQSFSYRKYGKLQQTAPKVTSFHATSNHQHLTIHSSTSSPSTDSNSISQDQFTPVFDFTSYNDDDDKKNAIDQFERIDDAIMGGISTSTLRQVSEKPYASFSGVCREDGGGFCGMRTLPFVEPLNATSSNGVFLDCKLVSDDEPDRRSWKMTVRTDSSRGEQVYQAQYKVPKGSDQWQRIMIPFDSFRLVRGPRLIPDAPPLNTTGGLFQIGMTMSKFIMNENTTTVENFRAGYFNLNIQQIGLFSNSNTDSKSSSNTSVKTLSKEDAARNRPLLFRIIIPVAKLFFSEQANRRKSAMRILREERGLHRGQAILFGIRSRANTDGMLSSMAKTLSIVTVDLARTVLKQILKVCLVLPLKIIRKFIGLIQKYVFRKEPKKLPAME